MNSHTLLEIIKLFPSIQTNFPMNEKRKNLFLSTCKILDETVDLNKVDMMFPYGGLVGRGNSCLDSIFNKSKLFRLHAILHDAAGSIKSYTEQGPGYCYMHGLLPNCCLMGHITGLLFCFYIKIFNSNLYKLFDC